MSYRRCLVLGLAGWLEAAAEVKSAPVDYVALSLLTAASAVIGNARWAVVWDS